MKTCFVDVALVSCHPSVYAAVLLQMMNYSESFVADISLISLASDREAGGRVYERRWSSGHLIEGGCKGES